MSRSGIVRQAGQTQQDSIWDVVVIGAGPAGSLTAYLAARRSLRTLLIDKDTFPRQKVCGGCLNHVATAVLVNVGLGGLLDELRAVHLDHVTLVCGGKRADLPVATGRAVSRAAFDFELATAASRAGAVFRAGVRATVLTGSHLDALRYVRMEDEARRPWEIAARVVVVADGLGHPSLQQEPGFRPQFARRNRIGLATAVRFPIAGISPHGITMAIGRHGYLGCVRLGEDQYHVAAAIDSQTLKRSGANSAIHSLLDETGMAPWGMNGECAAASAWLGTRPLPCQASRVAGHRLFLVGDAAGYVEPFTGEGIAWALESAVALSPLLPDACHSFRAEHAQHWQRIFRRRIMRQRHLCQTVRQLLQRPRLTQAAVSLLGSFPQLAAPLISYATHPGKRREVLV